MFDKFLSPQASTRNLAPSSKSQLSPRAVVPQRPPQNGNLPESLTLELPQSPPGRAAQQQRQPPSVSSPVTPGMHRYFDVGLRVKSVASMRQGGAATGFPPLDTPVLELSCQGKQVVTSSPEHDKTAKQATAASFHYDQEPMEFKRLRYHPDSGILIKVTLKDLGASDSHAAVATGELVLHGDGESINDFEEIKVHLTSKAGSPWVYSLSTAYTLGHMVEEDTKPGQAKADAPPNLAYVTIFHAKDLPPVDGGSGDPYVRLSCGRWEAASSKKEKTLNPVWNEKFLLPLGPQSPPLLLAVYDHNKLIPDTHMGEVAVSLADYCSKDCLDKPYIDETNLQAKGRGQRYIRRRQDVEAQPADAVQPASPTSPSSPLLSPSSPTTADILYYGSLRFKITPIYGGPAPDVHNFAQAQVDYDAGDAGGGGGDMSDGEGEALSKEEQALEQERVKAERAKFEAEMARIEAVEVRDGHYTVIIHVIEARDLKAEDVTGTNDPVVHIECFGQTQHSKIKNECNSCIFDDLYYFELKDMTKDDLQAGSIRVAVKDADLGGATHDMIGAFQTDFDFIYFKPDHEMYRGWVPLIDSSSATDSGAQGYLLLSITILGPGDKAKLHDRKREIEAEQKAMGDSDGGLPSTMALMPQITQQLHFLVVTLYAGFDIPPMDRAIIPGQRPSIDAYVKITFGDGDPVKSKVTTVSDKANTGLLTVSWDQKIYIPVMTPTMSNRIEISVWDKDTLSDEIVGTCAMFNYNAVQKGFYETPFFAPVYGATMPDGNPLYNGDERTRQNTKPKEASLYRGKVLLSLHEDKNEGTRKRPQKVVANPLKPKDLPPRLPKEEPMVLRCCVYSGNDLPPFSGLGSKRLSVKVCCGPHSAQTEGKEQSSSTPGVLHWNGLLQIPHQLGGGTFKLPVDPHQAPDVYVYLVKGKGDGAENVCFLRFTAKELLASEFEGQPKWHRLGRDKMINAVREEDYPGSLLLRLGLGPASRAEAIPWEVPKLDSFRAVRLNAYIYMGRDLCPADESGLLDPYVKVRFNGITQKTHKIEQTRNPNFFTTLFFDTMLPADSDYWPEVAVEVWDWDQFDPDDWVGSVRIPARDLFKTDIKSHQTKKLPPPKWRSLSFFTPEDAQGELLLNFELMTKSKPDENVPTPRDITPELEDCTVEILPVGLRDLRQKGIIPVTKPYVQLRVGDEPTSVCTNSSSNPSRTDPNFKHDLIRIPCRLPKDPMFAPCLNIAAMDRRMGGLSTAVLGTASIPLGPRMRSSPDYRPPGGQPFVGNPFMDEPAVPKKKVPIMPTPTGLEETKAAEPAPRGSMFRLGNQGGSSPRGAKTPTGAASFGLGTLINSPRDMLASSQSGMDEVVSGASAGLAIPSIDVNEEVEEEDPVEKYMVGRHTLMGELECHLDTTPFEEFALYKGVKRANSALDEPFQKSGYFKALLRVLRDKSDDDKDPLPISVKDMAKPAGYQVRVYVLTATRLRAKDIASNSSDPYIKVKLGSKLIDDVKLHKTGVVNDVEFYRYYELPAKFPGVSKLELSVWDWDLLGSNEVIGSTTIDLEDRWFSEQWQGMGWDKSDPAQPRLLKPLETRSLYSPDSVGPQGSLTLWVDIIPSKDVGKFPVVDITPAPQRDFELRVIIWKVRDWSEAGDELTGLTDMFFKARMGTASEQWQSTDTHLRAKSTASFNWRMKFPLSLPAKGEGSTHLTLQTWDLDLTTNDMMVEMGFDLTRFFAKALKNGNEPLHYFDRVPASKLDVFSPKAGAAKGKGKRPLSMRRPGTGPAPSAGTINGQPRDIETGATEKTSLLRADKTNPRAPGHARMPSAVDSADLPGAGENKSKKKQPITLWDQVKDSLGMGPMPEYSDWVKLAKMCRGKNGQISNKVIGEVCISMEIMPKAVADAKPAGNGREQPNSNPTLPDPEGRPDPMMMLNPIYALKTCLGEGLLAKFCSVFCCMGFFVAFIFVGPAMYDLVEIAMNVPGGGYIFFFVTILACVGCVYSARTCQKACGCGAAEDDSEV